MRDPVIFISAATLDLEPWRDHLHNAFSRAGFRVLTQKHSLPTAPGDVRRLLTETIDKADCVLHLAGRAYGSHASEPFPEMSAFQCSWTQFEYYYAHQQKKDVIALVCAPNLSTTFVEKSDNPADPANPKDIALKTKLQEDHRKRVETGYFIGTPLEKQYTGADGKPLRTSNEFVSNPGKLMAVVAAEVGRLHTLDREHCERAQKELSDIASSLAEFREESREFYATALLKFDDVLERIDAHDAEAEARRAAAAKPPPLPPAPPPRKPSWLSQFFWGRDQAKNRERMLKLVRIYQIDGILHEAVREMNQIEIDWKLAPDAVIKHADMDDLLVSTGQGFASIFHRIMDRQVLILGEPGSGKTILLLQLCEVLLKAAENPANKARRIPIVLNLSSWAEKQLPLDDWIVEETHLSYLVPRRVVRQWCEQNAITPLLDGLDEVKLEHRRACLDAIQLWRARHPARGMAVCSRIADYEALQSKFDLPTAIRLQPLTDAQINPVLKPDHLAGLRALLDKEPWFRDQLRTVLILNFAAYAYAGADEQALRLPSEADEEVRVHARLKHLYDTYITRRFEDSSTDSGIPETKLRRFLGWLSTKMDERNHTRFHLENLQIDWLNTKIGRVCFAFTSMIACALAVVVPTLFLVMLLDQVVTTSDRQNWEKLGTMLNVIVLGAVWCASIAGVIAVFRDWRLRWMAALWSRRCVEFILLGTAATFVLTIVNHAMRSSVAGPTMLRAVRQLITEPPPLNEPGIQEGLQFIGNQTAHDFFEGIASIWNQTGLMSFVVLALLAILPRRLVERGPLAFGLAAFFGDFAFTLPLFLSGMHGVGGVILAIFASLAYGTFLLVPITYFGLVETSIDVGQTKRGFSFLAAFVCWFLAALLMLPMMIVSQQVNKGMVDLDALWMATAMSAFIGLFAGVIGGITRSKGTLKDGGVEASKPNQGLTNSIRGAARLFWTTTLITSLIAFLAPYWGWTLTNNDWGISLGSPFLVRVLGSFCSGLVVAGVFSLFSGIDNPVKHILLRVHLWLLDRVPLLLEGYSKASAAKFLLRRVGGGFEFIHRSIREHFVASQQHNDREHQRFHLPSWLTGPWGMLTMSIVVWIFLLWSPLMDHFDQSIQLYRSAMQLPLDEMESLGKAETLLRQSWEVSIKRRGKEDATSIATMSWLGHYLYLEKHYAEADALNRECLTLARKSLRKDDPILTNALRHHAWNLAQIVLQNHNAKQSEEVVATYHEIIQRTRDQYVFPCIATATPIQQLTAFLNDTQQWSEAEKVSRDLLALREQVHKSPHVEIANARRNVLAFLIEQGRFDEALPLIDQAVKDENGPLASLDLIDEETESTARCRYWLARIQEGKSQFTEARATAAKALDAFEHLPHNDDYWIQKVRGLIDQLKDKK